MNILFLFPDQHRSDYVGFDSSNPVRTPNLDAVAARGSTFRNAVSPSPLCGPCRTCIATGKAYPAAGVRNNGQSIPDGETLLYHHLQNAGYHTMGCGKFDLQKPMKNWGLDGRNHLKAFGLHDGMDSEGKMDGASSGRIEPRGPYMQFLETRGLRQAYSDDIRRRWCDYYGGVEPCPLPDDAYGDNWVGRVAEDLIRRAPKEKPWFIQVNFPGPHDPWDITESMQSLYDGIDFPPPVAGTNDPEKLAALNRVRQNYAAMVTNIDRWTGRLIEAVKVRGELDNTLIVYTSDHGEMLGDHNRFIKQVPYQQSVGVPLIIAGPCVKARQSEERPVTILDLSATFLDYADAYIPKEWDSHSMKDYLQGENSNPPRTVVTSALDNQPDQDINWRMAYDGRFKLVENFPPGQRQLWDLHQDSDECINLLTEPPKQVDLNALEAALNTSKITET